MEKEFTLESLLELTRNSPLREHEDIFKINTALVRMLALKDEKDGRGRLTQAAKDARQRLRNPQFKTTHRNTKRRALKTAHDNQQRVTRAAHINAITEHLKEIQIALELEQFTEEEPAESELEPSREAHGGEYAARFMKPLMTALGRHSVTRSQVKGAPSFIHDVAARIYAAGAKDPNLEDETSLLGLMAKAGIFELFAGEMSDAEKAVFDHVLNAPESDEVLALQREFAERFPTLEPVSVNFIRGCLRLRDMTEELSPEVRRAGMDVRGDFMEKEARVVASILGWDEQKMLGAASVVKFIRERGYEEEQPVFGASFLIFQVQTMLDRFKPDAGASEEWLPAFTEWIVRFASQVQQVVQSETVFFALMYAAFNRSLAKVKFDELISTNGLLESLQQAELARREAFDSGKAFKLTSDGWPVMEDDEDYHFIPSIPVTQETATFDKIIPLEDENVVAEMGSPVRFSRCQLAANLSDSEVLTKTHFEENDAQDSEPILDNLYEHSDDESDQDEVDFHAIMAEFNELSDADGDGDAFISEKLAEPPSLKKDSPKQSLGENSEDLESLSPGHFKDPEAAASEPLLLPHIDPAEGMREPGPVPAILRPDPMNGPIKPQKLRRKPLDEMKDEDFR